MLRCTSLVRAYRTRSLSNLLQFSTNSKADQSFAEVKYERKTQLEHIMLRPGMYIGLRIGVGFMISKHKEWLGKR